MYRPQSPKKGLWIRDQSLRRCCSRVISGALSGRLLWIAIGAGILGALAGNLAAVRPPTEIAMPVSPLND